jgi:hypothetical protein
MAFITDLASRLANRVQLTSDGHKPYLEAVEANFGADIDYSMLVKIYSEAAHQPGRYSPADCKGAVKTRMGSRRFTRLTNAFSNKTENHPHSVAIHTMHYNVDRIHQTLRCTPAMAAGVTPKLWELEDMVKALEEWEAAQG